MVLSRKVWCTADLSNVLTVVPFSLQVLRNFDSMLSEALTQEIQTAGIDLQTFVTVSCL